MNNIDQWFEPNQYSAFDTSYLEEFNIPTERTQQEIRSLTEIISNFDIKPKVLDVACGYGRIGHAISSIVASYTGLDLNINFLKLFGNYKLVNADMRYIPFRPFNFQLILLMFTSFGYFNDEDNIEVLKEFYRVLSPGGMILLDIPNYDRITQNFVKTRIIKLNNETKIMYQKRLTPDGKFLIEERLGIYPDEKPKFLNPIRLRVYRSHEIVDLCSRIGFSSIKLIDQELNEFSSSKSKRLWLSAIKENSDVN